jgi:hypothetical protein
MGHLRIAALAAAAAAAAACGRAGAEPEPAPAAPAAPRTPAGWEPLPSLARAAEAALGDGPPAEAVVAWGDSVRGCYALWVVLPMRGSAEEVAAQVIASLAAAGGTGSSARPAPVMAMRDIVAPRGDRGALTLAFTRGEHRGRLRVDLGGGRVAAVACFANAREPEGCDAACASLLGAPAAHGASP